MRKGDVRDPRHQREGAQDQDTHGRKQSTERNQPRSMAGNDAREAMGGAARGGGSGRDRYGPPQLIQRGARRGA